MAILLVSNIVAPKIIALLPRLVVASLIAFWAGEFANSYVMAKMKVWTSGKHLWTGTVGSTVTGQQSIRCC